MKRTPVAAFAALILFSGMLQAQTQVRIQTIDNQSLTRIANSTHPLANAKNDYGRVDPNLPMERMVLVLKPSPQQKAALKKFLDTQQDTESTNFHKWLTPEQFGEQFGPAKEDLAQITAWLQQQGFTVGNLAGGKQWIEFSGTAAQVESAFHTEMHNYLVNGQHHVANSTDISLPQAMTPVVSGVLSLHNFLKQPFHIKMGSVHRDVASGRLVPELTGSTSNGIEHFVAPGDQARIYDAEPLFNEGIKGNGVSIAIVSRTDINLSDVQTFRQAFGLPAKDPEFVINGVDPGNLQGGDEIEADLDVEWSGAIAPAATIKLVSTQSTFPTDGIDLSISYIVDKVTAPIMSVSFGQCEAFLGNAGNEFFNDEYEQAAAEGITVFVASGDSGAAGCDAAENVQPATHGPNISGIASTPFNTAVGGTEFNENGLDGNYWLANDRPDLSSAVGYIPEQVWNESCNPTADPNQCLGTDLYFLDASGGGPSFCVDSTLDGDLILCLAGYAKPSWQSGLGVPDDESRDIPDISLDAAGIHDPYLICFEGSCQTTVSNGQTILESAMTVGGTSAAAPSMAGIMALVEQKVGMFQGLANYNFYKLAAAEKASACNSSNLTNPAKNGTCVFHDVTAGNNSVPGQVGANATPGFDLATGLGTVDAANLAAGWGSLIKLRSATKLAVAEAATVQHGQPLPVNVVVKPASGTGAPSGDFSLLADQFGVVFGGTLTNGSFAGTVSDLPGGTYELRARYGGDATFAASQSSNVAVKITPEGSQVGLRPAAFPVVIPGRPETGPFGPYYFSQVVEMAISVQGLSGIGIPTGTLTFSEGVKVLGHAPLGSGTATVEIDNLPAGGFLPGNHTLNVTYDGDNSFQKSTQQFSFRVLPFPPFSSVEATPTSITTGAPVQLLLSVQSPFTQAGIASLPTGTVQLYDNGSPLGAAIALHAGGQQGAGIAQATITLTSLAAGQHLLELGYSGDSRYSPIAGAAGLFDLALPGAANVSVTTGTEASPKVNLRQSPGVIGLGQSVNYVVTVAGAHGKPVPTGTVFLLDELGNTDAGPTNLVNGNASFTLAWNSAQKINLSAVYSGDGNYNPFSSAVVTTTVKQGTPKVILTAAARVASENELTSVSVSVIGDPANPNLSVPFGFVQFYDEVDGRSREPLGSEQFLTVGNGGNPIFTEQVNLPKGVNIITVRYLGGGFDFPDDWAPTTSNPVTITVH
jgi:pro-kumamolisin-like protein/Big-like domain-containing protein